MTEPMPLLSAEALTVEVGDTRIVQDWSFRLRARQSWCLLGGNGAGKTTLLHTLAGLRAPRSGGLFLNNTPLGELNRRQIARRLAILLQHQHDSFPASVSETVAQGRHPYLRAWQWESAADQALVADLLSQLELRALQTRNVQTLSGGERQRVAIATLLAQQTDILLLDEPLNHLDVKHRLRLLALLQRDYCASGRALLMSLHDVNLAIRFCSHALLLLGDGEIRQGPIAAVLDAPTLERLYGHPMLEIETPVGRAWLPG